jgi:hypothetical protein
MTCRCPGCGYAGTDVYEPAKYSALVDFDPCIGAGTIALRCPACETAWDVEFAVTDATDPRYGDAVVRQHEGDELGDLAMRARKEASNV